MRTKDPDEQWLKAFMEGHPVVKSDLPHREAAEIFFRDAEEVNPVLVRRLTRKWTLDAITKVCGYVQRGDEKKARRVLKGLSPDLIDRLLRAVHRELENDSIRLRRRCKRSAR